MNAQVMYDLLNYLNKNNSIYKEKMIRVLKLVYDDIYHKMKNELEDENCSYAGLDDFGDDVVDYIDGDRDSILYYLKDMLFDNKDEFVEAFLNKMDVYFQIVDNNLYREDDFCPYTLIFNIYAMLRSYHLYNNDYDKYVKYLDFYSNLIEPGNLNSSYFRGNDSYNLSVKKEIFDKMTLIDDFKEVSILKDKFNICFKNVCDVNYDGEDLTNLLEDLTFISNIMVDMKQLKEGDSDFDVNRVHRLIADWFDVYNDDDYHFYAPILLYKDRFDYIRDSYDEYIDNLTVMEEIMDFVINFDNRLFKYLDGVYKGEQDFFERCMNLVFDSDSLDEVINKLKVLSETSKMFSEETVAYQNVLNNINSLDSDRYKKIVHDKKIMYMDNNVNLVDKPAKIIERTLKIYKNIFGIDDHNYERISDYFSSDESIDSIIEYSDSVLEAFLELKEIESVEINELGNDYDVEVRVPIGDEEDEITFTEEKSNSVGENPKTEKVKKLFWRKK